MYQLAILLWVICTSNHTWIEIISSIVDRYGYYQLLCNKCSKCVSTEEFTGTYMNINENSSGVSNSHSRIAINVMLLISLIFETSLKKVVFQVIFFVFLLLFL